MTQEKVVATQMACSADRQAKLAASEQLVREAAGQGARIVPLRERFETLYFCDVHTDHDPQWGGPAMKAGS